MAQFDRQQLMENDNCSYCCKCLDILENLSEIYIKLYVLL